MSFKPLKQPSVDLLSGYTSRWNAVHQPIIFQMQRKDHVIDSIVDDSGNTKVRFGTDFDLLEVFIGAKIKIISDVYNGVYEILSIDGLDKFTIDTPYISDAVGFVNYLERKNYYIKTEILDVRCWIYFYYTI